MEKNNNSFWKKCTAYSNFGLLAGLVILLLAAAIFTPKLYSVTSLVSMLQNNSVYAIMTIGMMLILITGGIDLSSGAIMAMVGVITSIGNVSFPNIPGIVWLFASIIIGALAGSINGFLIGKLNMIPMIGTLGTMYIYRGLAFLFSGGEWIFPHQFQDSYSWFAAVKTLGFYNITWIAVIIIVLAGLFLGYTKYGRRIYAIGTNAESAYVAGIKDGNIKIMTYSIAGGLFGLAGMLYTANYKMCYYGQGEGYEMIAIAICVLGGVSISGGRGRIDGVVISILIMSLIYYFTSLLSGLSVWQNAIQGAIIIVAVAVNIITAKLSDRRALKERGALL